MTVEYQVVKEVLMEHLAEPLANDLLQEILHKDIEIMARELGIKREEAE